MLGNFLSRPIKIDFNESQLIFQTVNEFDFALSGRTSLPINRIERVSKLSVKELFKEYRSLKNLEVKLIDVMSSGHDSTGGLKVTLQKMDYQVFTHDHNWQEIFVAINNSDFGDRKRDDSIRRIALSKYLKYLFSRRKFIRYLRDMQGKMLVQFKSLGKNSEEGDQQLGTKKEQLSDIVLSSTLSMSVAEAVKSNHYSGFERIPKGVVLTLSIEPKERIPILLAKYKCQLVRDEKLYFIDHQGNQTELVVGRNVVGRDAIISNVVFKTPLKDISRLHLVIEVGSVNIGVLTMTDLSSHGSFLPPNYLEGIIGKPE